MPEIGEKRLHLIEILLERGLLFKKGILHQKWDVAEQVWTPLMHNGKDCSYWKWNGDREEWIPVPSED